MSIWSKSSKKVTRIKLEISFDAKQKLMCSDELLQ